MKTKAVVLYKTNGSLVVEELEIPRLGHGQVLVKVLATGVCRAQVNERKALKGLDRFLPHLMGHEGAGEVVEIGPSVKKVKKGDYVVLTWIKGEGFEGGPSVYKKGSLSINAGPITTFGTFAVISENRVVPIPRSVPTDIASVLGCAIPTGVGIIRNTLQVMNGTSIGIFGAGGVGSASILGAVMAGCKTIIVVDISKEKLDFSKHLGATDTINAMDEDILARINVITKGRGLDYAVEAAGIKSAMENAFKALSDSGKLAIAGNLKKGETISIVPYDLIKGKRIKGSWGGESDVDTDIPFYAKMYLNGKLQISKLISKKYTLSDVNEALNIVENNKSLGRVIIMM